MRLVDAKDKQSCGFGRFAGSLKPELLEVTLVPNVSTTYRIEPQVHWYWFIFCRDRMDNAKPSGMRRLCASPYWRPPESWGRCQRLQCSIPLQRSSRILWRTLQLSKARLRSLGSRELSLQQVLQQEHVLADRQPA